MIEPLIPVHQNKPDSQRYHFGESKEPYLSIHKLKPDGQVYRALPESASLPVWKLKTDAQVYTFR